MIRRALVVALAAFALARFLPGLFLAPAAWAAAATLGAGSIDGAGVRFAGVGTLGDPGLLTGMPVLAGLWALASTGRASLLRFLGAAAILEVAGAAALILTATCVRAGTTATLAPDDATEACALVLVGALPFLPLLLWLSFEPRAHATLATLLERARPRSPGERRERSSP